MTSSYLELLGLGEDLVGLLLGGGDEVQHLRHLRVLVHLAWVWSGLGCWVRVRVRDRVQCEPLKHRHAAAAAVGTQPLAPHPLALTRRSALALALLVRLRGAAPSTRRWSRSSTRRVRPSTRREAAPRSVRAPGGSAELRRYLYTEGAPAFVTNAGVRSSASLAASFCAWASCVHAATFQGQGEG